MQPPLLGRVATGDAEAVRQCVERYGDLLWTLARRHSPSDAEAEDAVQEIFLELWKSAARFDAARGAEVTFVAMVARRRLIDRRRARMRRGEAPLEQAPMPSVAPPQEVAAEATRVTRALEQLRPEQRNLLWMSAYQGLSHDEIAASTGMPLGTVKAHLRRGLLRLRELFESSESLP